MAKSKKIISMTLSEEVVEMLKVFKSKSKLVDDILSSLLLGLSKDEMFKLVMNDDNIAMYLIKRKCKEFNGTSGTGTEQVREQEDKSAPVSVNKKPKINPQDFWG